MGPWINDGRPGSHLEPLRRECGKKYTCTRINPRIVSAGVLALGTRLASGMMPG